MPKYMDLKYVSDSLLGKDLKTLSKNKKIDKLETFDVSPKRGLVLIWDARLLHRALPNTSSHQRQGLSFIIGSENRQIKELLI